MAPKKQLGILISQEQLDDALQRAAIGGAREVLRQLGLSDENAIKDISDVRNLLSAWRFAKRTVFEAFLKWLTIVVLGGILAGTIFHYGSGAK